MSQNETNKTETYIPKFAYPFKKFNSEDLYNKELATTPKGNYLFTQHGFWHGGPHFYGTSFDEKICAIADGELVAYRINSEYKQNKKDKKNTIDNLLEMGNGFYSTGFFLVRHKIEYPANNKGIFFSLYMHTANKYDYNIAQTQTPQTQSNEIYYTVKKGDTLGKIARENHTTIDKLKHDNNIVDVNKIRENQVLIVKTNNPNSSSQTQTPQAQSNTNPNPNFIVENPEFDKVVVLPTPKPINAGETIGLMGEYNQQKESHKKVLHLEVFANETFKTFLQNAKRGDGNLPQSFSWARVIEINSKDHISIFDDMKNFVLPKEHQTDEIKINESFKELFKLIDKDQNGQMESQEISKATQNIEIKKITNKYIVKHSSEWDKKENMAKKLYEIIDEHKDKLDGVDELLKHYENEKERIENLSFFEECKNIDGFPKDDKVYVINPIGLVNQFLKEDNCKRNFTVEDAKKALRVIYDTYGRDMAIIIEKMYRDETGNFKSKQYTHCGGAGMESHGKAPYHGWDSKLFKNPPICTWSAFENPGDSAHGGNKQVTDRKKIFMVFDTVLDAMIVKANYINKYNGDYARWHSTNKAEHDHYEKILERYIAYFVKEFDGEKNEKN